MWANIAAAAAPKVGPRSFLLPSGAFSSFWKAARCVSQGAMSVVVDLVDKLEQIKDGASRKDLATEAEDEDTYTVTFTKDEGMLFGLGYRVTPKDEVYITSVAATSLSEEWNSNCEVDKTICVGDRLLSCNGQTVAKSMLKEMRKTTIRATLLKSGPRWHISGITAESMEKISAARNKGLNFELQDVDTAKVAVEEPKINILQFFTVFLVLGIPSAICSFFFSDMGYGFKVFEIFAPYNRNQFGNLLVLIGVVFAVGLYVADWTQWPAGNQKYGTAVFIVYLVVVGAFFKMRFYPQVPLVTTLFHIPIVIAVFRASVLKNVQRKSFYTVVSGTTFFYAFGFLLLWLAWMLVGKEGENGWKGSHKWGDATKDGLVLDAEPLYKEWKITEAGDERRTYYDVDCDKSIKADHQCSSALCSRRETVKVNGEIPRDIGSRVLIDVWDKDAMVIQVTQSNENGLYCGMHYPVTSKFVQHPVNQYTKVDKLSSCLEPGCIDVKVKGANETANEYISWYDNRGAEYNCDWYAGSDTSGNNRCELFGNADYENFGMTATDACCVCSGGNSQPREYLYMSVDGPLCCNPGSELSSDAKMEAADNCAKVKTVWFLQWVSPFVVFSINFVIGAFALANGVWLNTADSGKLEKVMKQFTLMVFVLLLMMWVSVSVAGASMRLTGTLLAFCLAGMVALVVWVYLEIGSRVITISVQNSRLMQSLIGLATSDWVRAGMIIGLNIMIPLGLLVNMLNQYVRKLRGADTTMARFTEGMDKILSNLANWNWCSILLKVNWLVLLYWLLSVGVAKLTQVFLSWLNNWLLTIDFAIVIVIFFVIGFLMFMAPPVPGLPVYMSSGIVLASRARSMDEVGGFAGGTLIACALSFVLKLSACAGQYFIGYFMGKSVKIQQLVGVDKVFIRAVEFILQKRGIPLSKVAVLVGGPDWPTSVLCGILKLSLFQVELGTVPVIFVSSPVVLAGAFMAGPDEDTGESDAKSGIWETLTPVMMGIAGLAQLASGVVALYYIQEVIYERGSELAKPRKEHEPVAKLTKAEQEFVKAYNEVLDWKKFSRAHKPIIILSTLGMLISLFTFTFMEEACFYPFKVTNKIEDPYEDQGLNGNALNIVKWPGWVAHGVFFISTVMHFAFIRFTKFEANKRVQKNKQAIDDLVAEGTLASESESKRMSNVMSSMSSTTSEKAGMARSGSQVGSAQGSMKPVGSSGGLKRAPSKSDMMKRASSRQGMS